MLKKFTLIVFSSFITILSQAQPLNDDCTTATPVTIPASGNICVTGSNVGATSTTWTTATCGQLIWTNDVWYTFVSNGNLNTITIQPTGAPAAQRLGISVFTGGCAGLTGLGTYCGISATNGGTVTITQASPAGTQYWIEVSAFNGDGNFQLCINSTSPPPSPGTSCATAATLCDLSSFNLANGPAGTGAFTPNCFTFGANSSLWYQFTVGTTGSMSWQCTATTANTELDWAVFDITNGCGAANLNANTVACNYNYAGQTSAPIGMAAGSATVCPTSAATGTAPPEICPPITVTAGRTYVVFIDNFTNNQSGWNFNWTGSTFQMAPTSIFTLNTNKICGTTGTVTITNSSVGVSSQTWNFGDGSATSNAVNPGTHNYTLPGTYLISLTVTSATGCTDVSSQSIQIIAPPVLTVINDTICPGQQATIGVNPNPSGGTYSWNPGGFNSQTINVSPAATTPYTVTYTSLDNCTASATATVTISGAVFTVNAGNDSTICANQSILLNGTVNPVGNYTYTWTANPNGTIQNPNTLTPVVSPTVNTTYTLSVTDAGGCSQTDAVQVSINGTAVPVTATVNPSIICPGQQVQLNASVLPVSCGASPPCTGNNSAPFIGTDSTAQPGTFAQPPTLFGNFVKSGRNQMLYTAAEINAAVGGPCILKAVTFWIKIFNSNQSLQNFTIKMACTNLNSLTTWEQNLTTVYSAASYQPVAGPSNGFALTTPFAWDGVSNVIIDVCWYNASTFNNQNNKAACTTTAFTSYLYSSGNTDQCGTVVAPTTSTLRPNVKFNYCSPNINNYTVVWTPSTGANAVSNPSIGNPTANPVATTNYNVSVSNGGCAGTDVVTVTVDNSTLTAGPDKNSCPGAPVTLSATVGGSIAPGPATFVWTTLAGANVGNTQNVNVTPAVTTTYIVTMNGGSCVKKDTITVNIGALSPTAIPTNATCFGANNGKIHAASSTGTAPFSFIWSANAATGNVDSAINLTPGNYQVTVTDATGCSGTASATITQPTQVTFTSATINDSCFGGTQGSITITPSGGTGAYTYTWSSGLPSTQTVSSLPANNYSVTVRDANSCSATASFVVTQPTQVVFGNATIQDVRCFNGNTGKIIVTNNGGTSPYTYLWSPNSALHSSVANNLTAGTYNVTVVDAFGCTASATYNVSQPATGLTFGASNITPPTCFGYSDGSATVNPNGGVGTMVYFWSPSSQTTQTATNLSAQTYNVTVTDDSLCTATTTVIVNQPLQIQITGVVTDVKCAGGSDGAIDITVTNGVPNLSYIWNPTGAVTQDISALSAGNYSVTVTDNNACTAISTFSVAEPAALVLSAPSITDVLCFGDNTGSITVIHTGGTGALNYTWNPAGPNSATNSSLLAGSYSVTATDANACTVSATYTVNQPATGLSFGAPVIVNELCNGASTGSITVSVNGGTIATAYSYTWSPSGPNSAANSSIPAGPYTVTVTDDNGCTLSSTNTVIEPTAVTFGAQTITNVSCFGGSDGSAQITPTGGSGGYTYSWNGVAGSNPQTNLTANTYTVMVTDANNCQFPTTVIITEPAQLIVAPIKTDALCFGSNDGTVDANPSGGTPNDAFIWSTGATTQTITGLSLGLYTVTVTDGNGCSASSGANVNEPSAVIFNTQITQVKCVGDQNGTITAFPSGGTPPYTYSATMNGITYYPTNGVIEGLPSGNYIVTVIDDHNCPATQPAFVPAPLGDTYFITTDSTSCYGSDYADGALHIFGQPIVNGPFQFSVDGGDLQYSGDFYNLKAGIHSVRAQNNFGCDTVLHAIVPEPADATAEVLPSDTTLNLGESIQLSSAFSPYPYSTITSYSWSPATGLSCIDCPNPIATPYGRQTQYVLTITYNGHCVASASMTVLVDGGKPVYIPNSFSPNGDGNNDLFQIYGEGIKIIELKIFNRWGEKIYESSNQFGGWDGTYKGVLQNPAVFVYEANITYLNDKKVLKVGSVTLIK